MGRRITLILIYMMVTFALTSCSNYARHYSGPIAPKEKVAFVFNDEAFLRGKIIADNVEGAVEDEITIGSKPSCHELLPGTYSVEAWSTRSKPSTTNRHQRVRQTYGPIDAEFDAKPGHIYSLKSTKLFGSEKKLWFLTLRGDRYWELDVQDVTLSPKYQSLVAKINRATN